MTLKDDRFFMQRALRLAERGRTTVSPNPMVGCVVVRSGRIVGEGWHRAFGGPHAEAEAIRRAGAEARGATLYVTLEPCSHWGKTPPCAPAVARAGIKRVVAALRDPHPKVSGRGFAILRRSGVKIDLGVMKTEARFLNRSFIKRLETGLPYVIYKTGQTLDGKIASRTGKSRWITGPKAREAGHKLRAEADAILVGGETVRKDNPALTSHGKGPDPVRLVVSRSLNLDPRARIFHQPGIIWVIADGRSAPGRREKVEKAGAQILKYSLKNGSFDLRNVLMDLSKLNINQILLEGGGNTAFSLLSQGLVDEVYAFIAPRFLGGHTAPNSVSGNGWASPEAGPRLHHASNKRVGDDFLVHGFVDTPFTRSLF